MVNKYESFVVYNRQNHHNVPLAARRKWASNLERMKRNAERRGMKTTLEFTEFDDMTVSYLSAHVVILNAIQKGGSNE